MSVKPVDSETKLKPTTLSALLMGEDDRTVLVKVKDKGPDNEMQDSGPGDVVYTDLPDLKEILEDLKVKMAVIEQFVPVEQAATVAEEAPVAEALSAGEATQRGLRSGTLLAVGAIPAFVIGVGVALMVGALFGAGPVTNAYLAVIAFFGGLGLALTARIALREDSWDDA